MLALALEQLEAAFYQMVLDGDYFAGASDEEKTIMTDLRNHEVIHREVLRTALNSVVDEDMVIPELEFDFSEANVDFERMAENNSSRYSVSQGRT